MIKSPGKGVLKYKKYKKMIYKSKNKIIQLFKGLTLFCSTAFLVFGVFYVSYVCFPECVAEAGLSETQNLGIANIQGNSFLPVSEPCFFESKVVKVVIVTAYSSTTWQTDDTPLIAASGKRVGMGMIACPRYIPFGTMVIIDEIEYVCEDRMAKKHPEGYDIWFPTLAEAINFGRQEKHIEILLN